MAEKSEWQGKVGASWAAEYRRTDRSFTLLTEHLLAQTRGLRFRNVLDIGCGAGELSLAIARGRSGTDVVGVDVSPDLIEAAQARAATLTNCRFELADASQWSGDPAPDLLVSRHGVMFFEDPFAAFAHLVSQANSGARLLFSCFRDRSENPFFSEIMRLIPPSDEAVDPHAPGPFAFADRDRVHVILSEAGWSDITIRPFDFPMIAGAGAEPVEDALGYFSNIGPAAKAARVMDSAGKARFFDRVRTLAERNLHEGIVSLPAAAWIVQARRA